MLLNLPQCHPHESPSSWLTRIAISQGERLGEIMSLFELKSRGDIDLYLSTAPPQACDRFGINLSNLLVSRRVLPALISSGLPVDRYLLHGSRGQPRYRFCPVCVRHAWNPTIPVHWRFSAWRYCPLHMCLMEDCCHNCKADLLLPVSQITCGPGKLGVDHLGRCMACSHSLWVMPIFINWEIFLDLFGRNAVQKFKHGRSLLSALYFGNVKIDGLASRLPLSVIRNMDEERTFLNNPDCLNSEYIRERVRKYFRK
jgi:hypothetical protein